MDLFRWRRSSTVRRSKAPGDLRKDKLNLPHVFPKLVIQRSLHGTLKLFSTLLFCLAISLSFTQPVHSNDQEEEWIYTFLEDDNLWDITEKYLDGIGYWKTLQRLNNVEDPLHMPPGTQIRIPLHWLKVEAAEAVVQDSQGNNIYIPSGKTGELPLTKGSMLHTGDQVIVSAGGNALLEFPDGSLLYLAESAELTLQRVNRFSDSGIADTQSLLESGRSEIRVKTRGTRFEIRTPAANTAVRGTNFRTSVDSKIDGVSHIEVLQGVVGVTGAGHTRKLKAGFGTTIHQGEPPAPPVELLPAPAIHQPHSYSREFPVTIKWNPVRGAGAYRVQIRHAAGERSVLLDTVTKKPAYSTNTLKDASYIVQVRPIDRRGLEGLEGKLAFELDAQPQPPAVISPGHKQVVRTKLPEFEWAQPSNSDSFHLQVASGPEFNNIITEIKGYTETRYSPDSLQPGNYFWRLASIDKDEEGPFNQPLEFILRPKPDAPEASAEGNEQELAIRWSLAQAGQSYRLQVAKDEDFHSLLIDEKLERPEWQMERPKIPVHFRIQIIDVDGFRGAWSLSQKIDPPPLPWYYAAIPITIFAILISL